MEFKTWATLKEEIGKEMDMTFDDEDTSFVSATELMGYCNDALNEAEANIHMLYKDYFLKTSNLKMVDGTSEYSLPPDIYANKLRLIQYDDGSTNYEVVRINRRDIPNVEESDDYTYDIINPDVDTGMRLKLYPAARDTNSTKITFYYIRNITVVEDDNSYVEAMEFDLFIKNYIKYMIVLNKDKGDPMLPNYKENLEISRLRMREVLQEMVPDGNDDIEGDYSFYRDMV